MAPVLFGFASSASRGGRGPAERVRARSERATLVASVLGIVVTAALISLVVHEAGHWLAAHAFGAENVRVRLGVGGRRFLATVEADLDTDVQRIWFLLAGPIASALFGLVLVVMGGWWSVVGAVSILLGVLTLAGSDGRQAWALARGGGKSNDPH